jgi:hypothetical protein
VKSRNLGPAPDVRETLLDAPDIGYVLILRAHREGVLIDTYFPNGPVRAQIVVDCLRHEADLIEHGQVP